MKKILMPLLVLVILLSLASVAYAQTGKGWFRVDGLWAESDIRAQGDLQVDDDTVLGDALTVTGAASVGGSATFAGASYFTPSSAFTVVDNGVITASGTVMQLTAAGDVGASLVAPTTGRLLILVNTANQTITISETATASMAGDFAMAQHDTLTLAAVGTVWKELARSNN